MNRAALALLLACACVDADEVRTEFCQARPFFCDGGLIYPDAGDDDGGVPDAGSVDDGGTTDAGATDAGMNDGGTPDSGTPDAGDGGP
jgi:hypothetical protein